MTASQPRQPARYRAQPGDLVVAHTSSRGADTYEVGVVTRTGPDGLADAWRTADGSIHPARFVPGLQHRWLVPRQDIDAEQALTATARRDRPFATIAEVRTTIRPWLREQMHVGGGRTQPGADLEAGQ